MKVLCLTTSWLVISLLALAGISASDSFSGAQEEFRRACALRFEAAQKKGAAAIAEPGGWLFLAGELRFLSVGRFWGDGASKISRSHKPNLADPIPAIVDFQTQLKERGIDLVVVPVPPKAAIYPDKIAADFSARGDDAAPVLQNFYGELRRSGVEVLDLTPLFLERRDDRRGDVYCKTDTHWSGFGCTLAAQAIADKVRDKLSGAAQKEYVPEWVESQIIGDLPQLLPAGSSKPGPERIALRRVSEKDTGAAVKPDPSSPILLLGDSHTLVFHDFLAERAGLLDQCAAELGFAPDLIGTRGSGATPVRINLYRHNLKNPEYLSKKKVIVWCFAAREFTEATEGWAKIPLEK